MVTRVTTGQGLRDCYLIAQDGLSVLLYGGLHVGAVPFNHLAIEFSWKSPPLAAMLDMMHEQKQWALSTSI